MLLESALVSVPVFVLVVFRLAGLMAFAPLFGSGRIPRRVKAMLAVVLALGMMPGVPAPRMPESIWELTIGIAGEVAFGVAMGMVLSFVFIAAQWAGEMIGQQMGFNLSEVFDPQFGQGGSLIGELYFMLTLATFLLIGAHREMLLAVRMSFDALPLLSVGLDRPLLDTLLGLFQSCTILAVQLAAPLLVTMLVVDLALGCIGKAMPQMNVMTTGMSIRSLMGMVVLVVGIALTGSVLNEELGRAMKQFTVHVASPAEQ